MLHALRQTQRARRQTLGHKAEELTLVGQTVGFELGTQLGVHGVEVVPQFEEALTYFAALCQREVLHETPDLLGLLLVEKLAGGNGFIVAQVGEEGAGIDHVLVHVVEVGHDAFAPAVEEVERLLGVDVLAVEAVEAADDLDGVSQFEVGQREEEFVDRHVARGPHGLAVGGQQVVVEEE